MRESDNPDVRKLGEPISVIRPWVFPIVGVILFPLCFAGAGGMLYFSIPEIVINDGNLSFYTRNGHGWFSVIIFTILAVCLFAFGVFWLISAWQAFRSRIYLCPHGFHVIEGRKTQIFAWDDIVYVQETIFWSRPPLLVPPLLYLIPKTPKSNYTIYHVEGWKFELLTFWGLGRKWLVSRLEEEMIARGIPWAVDDEGYGDFF